MGELINLNPRTIADSDIPASIARDTETTAAIAAHTSATHPHLQYRLSATTGILETIITGTVSTSPGDTGVLHGIPDGSIIEGIQCTVWDTVRNWKVPPGFINTGYNYFAYTTSTHFVIYVPGGAYSGFVMGMPFNALIFSQSVKMEFLEKALAN